MNKRYLVIGSMVIMVSIFAGLALTYKSGKQREEARKADLYSSSLIRPHSPRLGNPEAKVTIVEFMDPACETCAQFYPLVKDIMKSHEGKVNLVVRYAALHPGSDVMVKVLEAVKRQGQFWPVLEEMFRTQQHWTVNHVADPRVFLDHMARAGFDMKTIEGAMGDPEIIKVLETDMADARRLGASKTPTFFVNGRPMPSFGYQQLADLVESEVRTNY